MLKRFNCLKEHTKLNDINYKMSTVDSEHELIITY